MLANWEHSGAFNADDFAGNTEPSLAIFIENGFTLEPLLRGNFALFAVIHNPTGGSVFPNGNSIQIAYQHNEQGNPTRYNQFTMQYYGSTTSGSGFGEGRFIKFRVLGVSNFEAVTTEERHYHISGFQLMFTGNTNPLAFQVGLIYKVTGFQVGLAAPGSPTLTARQYDLDFVRLDVEQTFYLTPPESMYILGGYPRRNMISSVYFSVPARFIHQYGELYAITALWYELQTTPILATPRASLHRFAYANIGRERNHQSGDYYVAWGRVRSEVPLPIFFAAGWNTRTTHLVEHRHRFLAYSFLTDDTHIVPRGEVIDWINRYTNRFSHTRGRGFLPAGVAPAGRQLSNDLFTNTVDAGRTRGRNNPTIQASDLLNLTFRRSNNLNYANIRAIEQITYAQIQGLSDARVAQDFFMWESDVPAFREHVRANSLLNNYTFVFRFANTNYYHIRAYNSGYLNPSSFSYIVMCTVFLDFTIIELEFDNGGVFTTVPVVMNPIDVVPDLVPPPGWNPSEDSCRWFEVLLFWVIAVPATIVIVFGVAITIYRIFKGEWNTLTFWIGLILLVALIVVIVLLVHFNMGPICWCLLRGGG
jgi:hypothetical protein